MNTKDKYYKTDAILKHFDNQYYYGNLFGSYPLPVVLKHLKH